jgi:hypothetical protein
MKILTSIITLFLFSCINNNIKEQPIVDNFYISKGSYDATRIPLIKPYQLIRLNGSIEWVLNLFAIPGSISNVTEVSVNEGLIFLHSGETYCNNEKVKESWVIINPGKNVELCFSNQNEFELAAKKKIKFVASDLVFKEFNKNGNIVW